jgi:hypothetical protein
MATPHIDAGEHFLDLECADKNGVEGACDGIGEYLPARPCLARRNAQCGEVLESGLVTPDGLTPQHSMFSEMLHCIDWNQKSDFDSVRLSL